LLLWGCWAVLLNSKNSDSLDPDSGKKVSHF
jgi:hypothetical protein